MTELRALLDTSVLLGSDRDVDPDDLGGGWAISAVSVGELDAGVLMATAASLRAARLRRLSALVAIAPVLAVDAAVASHFGELRAASQRKATNDLWIAATALAHGLVLVTRDRDQAALPLVRSRLVADI